MRVKRGEKKVNEETGGCDRFEVFEGDKDVEAWRGLCLHDIVCVCVWEVYMHIQMKSCVCVALHLFICHFFLIRL